MDRNKIINVVFVTSIEAVIALIGYNVGFHVCNKKHEKRNLEFIEKIKASDKRKSELFYEVCDICENLLNEEKTN